MNLVATITEQGIAWSEYPCLGATVHPRGSVKWSEIVDFDSGGIPPEVRTASGETLFVPPDQKAGLIERAASAGLRDVTRADVWWFLLEPFQDTEFTSQDDERATSNLKREGISARRMEKIRNRVGPPVLSWNCWAWEWAYLGMYHLLFSLNWDNRSEALSPLRRRRLYWWAMAIAELGQRKPRDRSE